MERIRAAGESEKTLMGGDTGGKGMLIHLSRDFEPFHDHSSTC